MTGFCEILQPSGLINLKQEAYCKMYYTANSSYFVIHFVDQSFAYAIGDQVDKQAMKNTPLITSFWYDVSVIH